MLYTKSLRQKMRSGHEMYIGSENFILNNTLVNFIFSSVSLISSYGCMACK